MTVTGTNLTTDPCLTWVLTDNTVRTLSLSEAFAQADEIRDMVGGTVQKVTLYILLFVIAADAFKCAHPGLSGDERHRLLWETSSQGFVETIVAYLNEHSARFEMDCAKTDHPFMQNALIVHKNTELSTLRRDPLRAKDDKGADWIPFHELLPALTMCLGWACSGIVGAAIGDPLAKGGRVYGNAAAHFPTHTTIIVTGPTLLDTLRLNITPAMLGDGLGDDEDIPPWRADPSGLPDQFGEGGVGADGPLSMLTTLYRTVRLEFDGTSAVKAHVGRGTPCPGKESGRGTAETRACALEYSPYASRKREDVGVSLRNSPPDGLLDVKAAICADTLSSPEDNAAGQILPPKVILALHKSYIPTDLLKASGVTVVASATDSMFTVIQQLTAESVRFDLTCLRHPALSASVVRMLESTRDAQSSFNRFLTDIEVCGRSLKPSRESRSEIGKHVRSRSSVFDDRIGTELRRSIADIHSDDDPAELIAKWNNTLFAVADQASGDVLAACPPSKFRYSPEVTSATRARAIMLAGLRKRLFGENSSQTGTPALQEDSAQ